MGIQEVSPLFKTTNSSVEILDSPDLLALKLLFENRVQLTQSSLDFIGETNWCSHIRSLLFRTNHCDVWENHRVENANRLIKQVKLCLNNIYKAD